MNEFNLFERETETRERGERLRSDTAGPRSRGAVLRRRSTFPGW